MVRLKGVATPLGITLALTVVLMWLLLVFNEKLAIIYMFMIFSYYVWFKNDPHITFPPERTPKGRLYSLVVAIAVYAVFLLVTSMIISSFRPTMIAEEGSAIASVVKLQSTATPVLADNKFLTFISWGQLIPIVETLFFFTTLFEGMAFYMGKWMKMGPISVEFNLANPYLWLVMIFIAFTFVGYHFQAKGIHDSVALSITFIFAIISMLLVAFFKHGREAIGLHAISNSMAVLSTSSFGFIALKLLS